MPSARQHAGEMFQMLTPEHLKKNETQVKVKFITVVPAPKDYRAPFIAKIVPVQDRDHLTLNKTNTNNLIELLGDDYSDWAGAEVTLRVEQYDNFPPGFVVESAKKSKTKGAPF